MLQGAEQIQRHQLLQAPRNIQGRRNTRVEEEVDQERHTYEGPLRSKAQTSLLLRLQVRTWGTWVSSRGEEILRRTTQTVHPVAAPDRTRRGCALAQSD